MPVQQCPFCQATLKIPRKHLGHPIDCPRCRRPFLAPVAESGTPPPLPLSRNPQTAAPERPVHPAVTASGAQAAAYAGESPRGSHGVATHSDEASATVRLVRPKPSATALTPTPDGALPELTLAEQPPRRGPDIQAIKSNPVFMTLVLALSLGASVLLLVVDFGPSRRNEPSQAEARARLREFTEVRPGAALESYQVELRLAQQAHSRGDYRAERTSYRKVLDRLLAEDRNPYAGVTGSPTRDIELQSCLSLLLSDQESSGGQ